MDQTLMLILIDELLLETTILEENIIMYHKFN